MWNNENPSIIFRNFCEDTFDLVNYKKNISTYLSQINESDTWIRSGIFINDCFKEHISSFQLIGKSFPLQSNLNIEILLVKTQIGVSSIDAEKKVTDFVLDYLSTTSADSAFVALVSSFEDGYINYFIASPSLFKIKIPEDILNYICIENIKNYITLNCSIDINDLLSLNTNNDSNALTAKTVDDLLKNIKFCDISCGSGETAFAMCSAITKTRYEMNKFFDCTEERTKANFINHFLSNSLYATDYHEGELETFKIGLSLNYPSAKLNKTQFVWGNILTENLFPSVAFDIVITNPPHMRQELFTVIKDKLSSYNSYTTNSDLYCYYTERAFSLLNKKGTLGLIMSNRWMQTDYGVPLRKFLLSKNIHSIVDYYQIRPLNGLSTPIALILADNSVPSDSLSVTTLHDSDCRDIAQYVKSNSRIIDRFHLSNDNWNFVSKEITSLIKKLNDAAVIPLSEYTDSKFYRGILTGFNEAFIVDNKTALTLIENHSSATKILRPILSGRDVKRYAKLETKKQIIFMPRGYTDKMRGETDPYDWLINTYPSIAGHLAKYEAKAMKRRDKGDYWWELRSCKYYELFDDVKILCPTIVKRLSATIDKKQCLSNDKTIIIASNDYYLLGLLNSSLLDFYFRNTSNKLLNEHFELKLALLSSLPIRVISKTNSFSLKLKKDVEVYAERLSKLNSINKNKRTDIISNEILTTERKLNQVIYKLYKLNPFEINLVENN